VDNSTGDGNHCIFQRYHLLNRAKEHPCTDACACKTYSASAGQAGESYSDCADAGRSAVAGMGSGELKKS